MKYTFSILFVVCLFGFFTPTLAQFDGTPQDDITVSMAPEFPGPNQTVSVSVVSYSTDINSANVVWTVNGVTKSKGRGVKTFSFTTGAMNTTTTLGIVVTTTEGQTIEKYFSVKPTSVDLIWQSDSYTPPFYKGKPMFSYQNKITFIAVPHLTGTNGVEIGAKSLVYRWTQNGTVLENVSGFGKNTYTTVGSLIARPLDVEVEVSSPNANAVGRARIVVSPVNPSVVMYEKNPLYGIGFNRALTNTVALGDSKEITVVAVPYHFGVLDSRQLELAYTWFVNGNTIPDDGHQTEQVFRQNAGVSGTSNISLKVENANKILQSSSSNFNLTF